MGLHQAQVSECLAFGSPCVEMLTHGRRVGVAEPDRRHGFTPAFYFAKNRQTPDQVRGDGDAAFTE